MDSLRPASMALYRRLEATTALSRGHNHASQEDKDQEDNKPPEQTAGDGQTSGPSGEAAGVDSTELMISPTDLDARLTRKGAKTVLGYKEHRVVDDLFGVITSTETTDAATAEARLIDETLNAHRRNTRLLEGIVAADKGYGTAEVYKKMRLRGVRPCIPQQTYGRSHGTFGTDRFKYDKEKDRYICPAGNELVRPKRGKVTSGKPVKYYCQADKCQACELKARCTASKQGRTVKRSPCQEIYDWAKGCFSSGQRRYLMGRRKTMMEGSFADGANNHGYKRARWRRLWRVKIQNYLVCICQNIRKLLKYAAGKPSRRVLSEGGLLATAQRAVVRGMLAAGWLHRRTIFPARGCLAPL